MRCRNCTKKNKIMDNDVFSVLVLPLILPLTILLYLHELMLLL